MEYLKSLFLRIAPTSVLLCILTSCGMNQDLVQERTTFGDFYSEDALVKAGEKDPSHGSSNPNEKSDDSTIPPLKEDPPPIKPDDSFDQSLNLRGEIQDVTAKGEVYGWAVFPTDTGVFLTVDLYINGDATTGTLLGAYQANVAGFDNGNGNNHAFRAQIPNEYRNGQTHTLTAYAEINGKVEPIFSNEFSFRAFLPTNAGQTYFNNTLRPLLQNNCGGCHGNNQGPAINYNAMYEYVLSPNPGKTGTATDNTLINKASGGMNHGGNNRCGNQGKNGNPCVQIQNWWNLEFGTN